jgi:alpha-tubulin suppressor-like RCC1 family protein
MTKVLAWGAGENGILGRGPAENALRPVEVPGLPPITQVATAHHAAFAIDESGGLWSWGWDSFEHLLGRGKLELPMAWLPASLRAQGMRLTERVDGDGGVGEPALVAGLPAITQVVLGDGNALVLTTDGEVWGWGMALGIGESGDKTVPTPTLVKGLPKIAALSANNGSSAYYALDTAGRVWSWGNGMEGELGRGTREHDPVPRLIEGIDAVRSVHAADFCVAALRADGTVWFWGTGQDIGLTVGETLRIKEPVRVPGLSDITQVFSGSSSFIVRTRSGETFAMGSGLEDHLGIDLSEQPVVRVPSCDRLHRFSLAQTHGIACHEDGRIFTFGDPEDGALGNGQSESQQYGHPAPLDGVAGAIAVAAGHRFSLAVAEAPARTAE